MTERSTRESVIVLRVIDGDTLVLTDNRTIRLANINTPEKKSPNSQDSSDFLKHYLNQTLFLEIIEQDKYSRYVGRLYTKEGVYLNKEIVAKGMATTFLVDSSELNEFSKAEKSAQSSGLLLWERSPFKGCVNMIVQPKNEIVILSAICENYSFSGSLIRDESRKYFVFPEIHSNSLTLHSGKGLSNSTDLFWGESSSVWNNDRDTAYLFDSNGQFISSLKYGY